MPGSQPGVFGLFTTPAKLLNYNNLFLESLSKSFYKEKALSIKGKAIAYLLSLG